MDTGLILVICLGSCFFGLILGAGLVRSRYEKILQARAKWWTKPPRGEDGKR